MHRVPLQRLLAQGLLVVDAVGRTPSIRSERKQRYYLGILVFQSLLLSNHTLEKSKGRFNGEAKHKMIPTLHVRTFGGGIIYDGGNGRRPKGMS